MYVCVCLLVVYDVCVYLSEEPRSIAGKYIMCVVYMATITILRSAPILIFFAMGNQTLYV